MLNPYSAVAILRARWGNVVKVGIASRFAGPTVLTSKAIVYLNSEKPEEIELVIPRTDGETLIFKAKCKHEPLNDLHFEDIEVVENEHVLSSVMGNLCYSYIETWIKNWAKEELHIVGISPTCGFLDELLEPTLLKDGYLKYRTSFGEEQRGSPLIFKIQSSEKWTLLGIHAFNKDGWGFGWPITPDVTDAIFLRDSLLDSQ